MSWSLADLAAQLDGVLGSSIVSLYVFDVFWGS